MGSDETVPKADYDALTERLKELVRQRDDLISLVHSPRGALDPAKRDASPSGDAGKDETTERLARMVRGKAWEAANLGAPDEALVTLTVGSLRRLADVLDAHLAASQTPSGDGDRREEPTDGARARRRVVHWACTRCAFRTASTREAHAHNGTTGHPLNAEPGALPTGEGSAALSRDADRPREENPKCDACPQAIDAETEPTPMERQPTGRIPRNTSTPELAATWAAIGRLASSQTPSGDGECPVCQAKDEAHAKAAKAVDLLTKELSSWMTQAENEADQIEARGGFSAAHRAGIIRRAITKAQTIIAEATDLIYG